MKLLRKPLISTRRIAVAALAAVGLAIGGLAALAPSPAALTGDQLCGPHASTTVQDKYVVQNNNYGNPYGIDWTQCVAADGDGPGFTVTRADGLLPASGPPKSYPSIYNGCYHGVCSPGTSLPMKLMDIRSASNTIDFLPVVDSVFDSSYKIFLDPSPRTDGANATEIDVWFNHAGDVRPIGTKVGTAGSESPSGTPVAGLQWDVWIGNNGSSDVITLVSTKPVRNWDFDVRTFTFEAIRHSLATLDWYVTSIQAGFETWEWGTNLAVDCFASTVLDAEHAGSASVGATAGDWWDFGQTDGGTVNGTVDGGTGASTGLSSGTTGGSTVYCPEPTAGTTVGGSTTCGGVGGMDGGTSCGTVGGSTTCGAGSAGTITSGGTSGSSGGSTGGSTTCGVTQGGTSGGSSGPPHCTVDYSAHTWPGGFTADVTISNTGTRDVDGWKLGFTLPAGQKLTSIWNATADLSSGSLTASSMDYNARIPAGGSQTFGFLGTSTGSTALADSFVLNGAACA